MSAAKLLICCVFSLIFASDSCASLYLDSYFASHIVAVGPGITIVPVDSSDTPIYLLVISQSSWVSVGSQLLDLGAGYNYMVPHFLDVCDMDSDVTLGVITATISGSVATFQLISNSSHDYTQRVMYGITAGWVTVPAPVVVPPPNTDDDPMTDLQMTQVFTHMSSQTAKVVVSNNQVMTALQAAPVTMGQIVSMCIGAAACFLFCWMVERGL